MDKVGSNEWDSAHDRGAYTQPPVGILVETHNLSGESHAEGEQQQNAARDPGQLAWIFESPEQEYLCHMDGHDSDHEVGAPKMQCAEIPAKWLIEIEILKSGVSLISGGHVHKGQTNTGHDLEHETKQRAAAEDVKPTPCAGGHRVACSRFEEFADMQSVVDPKCNFSQHARFLLFAWQPAEKFSCRLLKKISEARRAKIDERRRTLLVR